MTLSSTNGSVLNAVYGGGPEYAGATFDRESGQLWCGSNAPGGIDLCLVDPVSGGTFPTGAWVQKEGGGTNWIFAATAALDGPNSWSFITAGFSSVPGAVLVAVDISNKNYTTDRISYMYTFRNPAVGMLAGLHLWSGEDQPPPSSPPAPAAVDYDVVVYGSSPAGIAAAVAAGQLGLRVALYEPLKMIGGMGAAGNLALNDGGVGAERTGLARVFSLLNGAHYNVSTEVPHPESFVAAASFNSMLAGAGVATVKLDCRLLSAATAATGGVSRVSAVTLLCEPHPITATVFIDASYDGEVMLAAGNVAYTWGREANTTYGEPLAGARVPGWVGVHGPRGVDPFKPDGTLLKYVSDPRELAPPGAADDALMAFQHRMCVSGDDDRVPWPAPPGYNAEDFLLIQRALDASNGSANFFTSMPPSTLPGYPGPKKKYCLCCGISVGASDQPMLNKGWANASWERKQQIIADHTYFELGTFYYLANDPRVPAHVRATFSAYGLCRDEFVDNGYMPHQLYVRISNRLVGDYVMTQNNIVNPKNKNDSIAVGDWSLDEHMCVSPPAVDRARPKHRSPQERAPAHPAPQTGRANMRCPLAAASSR